METEGLELSRMRRERYARLTAEMERRGAAVALLIIPSNVAWACGARGAMADGDRANYERSVLIAVKGEAAPHLFTAYPEGAPPEMPAGHIHPPLYPDLEDGVRALANNLREIAGTKLNEGLAIDEYTAAMHASLAPLLDKVRITDAMPMLHAVRLFKTADEIECIRRAQRINELAMYDVQAQARPGARQNELMGLFLRRIFELGATANIVDPIWQPMAPALRWGPHTVNGDIGFPLTSTDRILRDGDVLWVDTGIVYQGYASDFGSTWLVSHRPRPNPRQRDQFLRWRDVRDAVLESIKPGATGRSLTRAATAAAGGRKPWMQHLYLIHGIGADSAEMPLIGSNLGEEFDEAIVLGPGMVMVMEPAIWDDAFAGYRSEVIVAVTENGYRELTDYSYFPYE
jgi:Xaa-Pro aminopeptidase